MLKKCFDDMGFTTYGGTDAPYIWVSMDGKPSWDAFAEILEKTNVVTTPGAGFGIAGEWRLLGGGCPLKPLMAVLCGLSVHTNLPVFVLESPQRAHLAELAAAVDASLLQ
jgi:hypothetical protein